MIAYQQIDSELQTVLWSIMGDTPHGPEKRRQYINDAIEQISESWIFRFLILRHEFSTTWDRSIYTTPVQYSTIALFRNGRKLEENVDWIRDSLAEDFPHLIAIWTEDITFPDPNDTADYVLKYRWAPTLSSSDDSSTAVIQLPSNFKKSIVTLAAAYGFREQNNEESAVIRDRDYEKKLLSLRGVFINRSENNPTRVSSQHKF